MSWNEHPCRECRTQEHRKGLNHVTRLLLWSRKQVETTTGYIKKVPRKFPLANNDYIPFYTAQHRASCPALQDPLNSSLLLDLEQIVGEEFPNIS